MVTVSDIMGLPAIRQAELVAPCPDGPGRAVHNVGILDVGPEINGYTNYFPGEFILTNLGFAKTDQAAEDSLMTIIDRGVAGVGIKTVYGARVSEAAREHSTQTGVPVYLYDGAYHEHVVYQALSLIESEKDDAERERIVDRLASTHGGEDVRKALDELSGMVPTLVQFVAVRDVDSDTDALARRASLENVTEACRQYVEAHDDVRATDVCRYQGVLLITVSMGCGVAGPIIARSGGPTALPETLAPLPCGVSDVVEPEDADIAIRQALGALDSAGPGRRVATWSELGFAAFSQAAHEDRLFSHAAAAASQRLIAENDGIYQVARTFVKNHGSVERTAHDLGQHPNTVRNRLTRTREVLGMPDASNRELLSYLSLVFLS
jgi:hypothetical protein